MPKKVMLTIQSIESGSLADKARLRPGDIIQSVNDMPVSDEIDFQFYASAPKLKLNVIRQNSVRKAKIKRREGQWLGIEFQPMDCMSCGNACIFCFVDQNAQDMRETLYFKDEDYRHSFLYGNYVTMTTVSAADIDRIINQRLSPLYISVHAAKPDVRRKLLGITRDDHLFEKIKKLVDGGIEIHAQIVLCRGINDGTILDETLHELAGFYPSVKSVAIVPVGLTKHREGLVHLQSYDGPASKSLLKHAASVQHQFVRQLNTPFSFFADEFYLRADEALPDSDHYEGFWQIENGVGMMRRFLSDFSNDQADFPEQLEIERRIVLVSGALAGPVVEKVVMPRLAAIKGLQAHLVQADNSLYGKSVTVTGLLSGEDCRDAALSAGPADLIVLPPNCINQDGLFLDNLTISDLETALEAPVTLLDSFAELWDLL
ncbi:DUF512 domain-containing protein [bacterium]|nr:DUF512 domain-containing protein [bacterium]